MNRTFLCRLTAAALTLLLLLSLAGCDRGDASSALPSSKIADLSSAVQSTVSEEGYGTPATNLLRPDAITEEDAEAGGIRITLKEVKEEFDLTPAAVRTFVEETAQGYDTNDYSVTKADSAVPLAKPGTVTLEWKYNKKDDLTVADVDLSLYPDFRDAISYSVGTATKAQIAGLQTGATYYWCVAVKLRKSGKVLLSHTGTFQTKPGVRIITVDGVNNFRDVGGWKTLDGKVVKEGLVYRSCQAEKIMATGLVTTLKHLKIKTDIDLRSEGEIEKLYPDNKAPGKSPLGDTVQYINISSPSYEAYFGMASRVLSIIRPFADPANYPIWFHCVAGADRTGTLAIFLKAMLGVSENDLVADYEITPDRNRTRLNKTMEQLKEFPGDTLQEKARNFYRNVGLTDMEIGNIYNIMMTDSAIFRTDAFRRQLVTPGKQISLPLDLRESGSVTGVTVEGKKAKFSFDAKTSTLKVTTSGTGRRRGVITFDDGATLLFEYDVY